MKFIIIIYLSVILLSTRAANKKNCFEKLNKSLSTSQCALVWQDRNGDKAVMVLDIMIDKCSQYDGGELRSCAIIKACSSATSGNVSRGKVIHLTKSYLESFCLFGKKSPLVSAGHANPPIDFSAEIYCEHNFPKKIVLTAPDKSTIDCKIPAYFTP